MHVKKIDEWRSPPKIEVSAAAASQLMSYESN